MVVEQHAILLVWIHVAMTVLDNVDLLGVWDAPIHVPDFAHRAVDVLDVVEVALIHVLVDVLISVLEVVEQDVH